MVSGSQKGAADIQRRRLLASLTEAGLDTSALWLRYLGMGGDCGEYEIDAYVHGLVPLCSDERDLLAQAANELIDELPGLPRAPYSDEIADDPPEHL